MANLTDKQEKFWEYYKDTGNGYESAKKAGYSDSTAYHWRRDVIQSEGVQEAIKEKLSIEIFRNRTRILDLFDDAVDDLRGIIQNKENKASVRIQADKTVFEQIDKISEIFEINKEDDNKISELIDATKKLAEQRGRDS